MDRQVLDKLLAPGSQAGERLFAADEADHPVNVDHIPRIQEAWASAYQVFRELVERSVQRDGPNL